ncbi:YqcC family protein [Marinobacter hydrocarbonoclasticus]|nr:YqcC family protein [Marinobacter nauticus]
MPHSVTVNDTLNAIEQAMRHAGLWQSAPPSSEALASPQPFCCDTLAFEQWVQWILLPRLRALLEANLALPGNAAIAPMAEEVWRGRPELGAVINELRTLDAQLSGKA